MSRTNVLSVSRRATGATQKSYAYFFGVVTPMYSMTTVPAVVLSNTNRTVVSVFGSKFGVA